MSIKTTAVSAIIIILLATLAIIGFRFLGDEDVWICQDGQWVKHGNPSGPMPESKCSLPGDKMEKQSTDENNGNGEENIDKLVTDMDIQVSRPSPGDLVSSPLEVTGKATGLWFFEGDFPVKLLDRNGKEIAISPARALGEWMTEDLVPFRAILEFSSPFGSEGTLVFSQDDPSDMAAIRELKIPVKFDKKYGQKIKLFFSNLYYDPETKECEGVYEVERVIPETKSVAKAAIEELLSGLTEEEKDAGYFTSINSGVKLKSISIAGGIAKVDFDGKMEEGMGGACRTAAIKSQIEQTLKQFPTVKSVVISVEGKTEGILQP